MVLIMSGFVRVSASCRVGSVVARPLASGWVWASRPLPSGGLSAGFSPAPACLFVPFSSLSVASSVAASLSGYGFSCSVRSGSAGSPVFSSCGLPVPAFVLKVRLCSVWPCARASDLIRSILSAGVIVSAPLGSLSFAL